MEQYNERQIVVGANISHISNFNKYFTHVSNFSMNTIKSWVLMHDTSNFFFQKITVRNHQKLPCVVLNETC